MGRKKFNLRAFVSLSLFVVFIVVVITGLSLPIIENNIDPALMNSLRGEPKIKAGENIWVTLYSAFRFFHIYFGLLFTVLTIVHIAKNWKVLKNYMRKY
ncbi:MAG: hypothetical protein LBL93_07540 [Ruminococcus sp.]|jgi:hypothetical protein|nr:hypothetical protein [Ruminococcus sp.]